MKTENRVSHAVTGLHPNPAADTCRPASSKCNDKHLLIIGGGSAAFSAAIQAVELGARVTLIERATLGGTCVNIGCVPSKTLIQAAEHRHRMTHPAFDGIAPSRVPVDMEALIAQKDELVSRLQKAKYADMLGRYPDIRLMRGHGRFTDAHSVCVRHQDGGEERISAARILIATGTRPAIPDFPGLAQTPYWTSTGALDSRTLPKRLIVLGGGAVGVELAQTFARLGSRVTLVARSGLLSREDPILGAALAGYLDAEGLPVLRAGVRMVRYADGTFFVSLDNGDILEAEACLVATGRRANTDDLGLEAAGVALTDRGAIPVTASMRSNVAHIYAAGDVTDRPQYVYVAAAAGRIAALNALTDTDEALDLSLMPAVTFSDPQVASIGLDETGARQAGMEVIARFLPMDQVPRALANRDTRGFIKLVARRADTVLIGAQILAPQAGEMIQIAALAIKAGMRVQELGTMLFPYLTLAEGIKLTAQTFSKDVKSLSCCAG